VARQRNGHQGEPDQPRERGDQERAARAGCAAHGRRLAGILRRFQREAGKELDGRAAPSYAPPPNVRSRRKTMGIRLTGRVVLLVACCAAAGETLCAQLQTGRLVGTVLDEQRAAVPGATVTVSNLATNIARTVTSDAEGTYVVTPLEPGIYRISASLQGFQTTVRDRGERTVGQS